MPYFNYSGYNAKGKLTKGTIESSSSVQAVERLTEQGIVVVDIAVSEEKKGKAALKLLPLDAHIFFCRSLASYLRSGLPLVDSLRIMSRQSKDKNLKAAFGAVLSAVEGGKKFHAALSECGAFRESLWRVVESGEQSGSLISVLNQAASQFKMEDGLKRKIKGAMTYPIVMLIVGTGVVSFMLTYVVPKIAELFEDMHQTLPLPTRMLISMSSFLSNFGIPIIIVILIAWLIIKRRGIRINLPFMRGIREQLTLSLVLSHIATLLRSGIPLVQALRMASSMDPRSKRWLDVADLVKAGHRFDKALEKTGFPEEAVYVIRVGEMGGELADALTNVAQQSSETAESNMERISTLMEPAMVLIMGFSVGFIVLGILTPVFDLAGIVK